MELNEQNHRFKVGAEFFVKTPSGHQGVSNALRQAFAPLANSQLPDDIEKLLDRLRDA